MLDPPELLAAARRLAAGGSTAPSDAELRRAVSTAYYAAFHTVLRLAADRFVGPSGSGTAAYALIYRGYAHTQMKKVCEDVNRQTLSERYRNSLKRNAVADEIRSFAYSFVKLQRQRYQADNDPQIDLGQSDAFGACDLAELTMQSLQSAPEPDRTDFLALLLVNLRG